MFYVVSFDGCGIEGPLQSRTAASALALAEEAERNGCRNVLIQVPDGPPLTVSEFAERYCPPDPPEARPRADVAGSREGGSRSERRERHAAEVEASQGALRESITATEKLVDESDRMLRRHRKECDEEENKPSE